MKHEGGSANSQKAIPKVEGCSHHFGYLNQRPKSEETPEECIMCKKLVECMLSTFESTEDSERIDKSHAPVSSQKTEHEAYTVKDSLEKAVSKEPEANAKPIIGKPANNKFKVENLDMIYRSWSRTARIDELVLLKWGEKVDEVEIETAEGKKAQCRVYPIKEAKNGVVQVPDKIQFFLGIAEGELVTVRPIKKKY